MVLDDYNNQETPFLSNLPSRRADMPFYDRKRELAILDDLYKRTAGQMLVLYGRRRIGKTALLTHWINQRKHPALFWTADRTGAANQLRAFSQLLQRLIAPHSTIPPEFTYTSWELVFNELARLCESQRLIVVLDEFTYVLESNPGLASILQRIWDHRLQSSKIFLVLSGSHAGMIVRETLTYRSPLYGRATQSIHLHPLPFGALSNFFPEYSMPERVTLYACLGGVPHYLRLCDAHLTAEENLERLLASSLILDDAGTLLRDQLSEPRNYVAIIENIVAGYTRLSEIATMSGMNTSNASQYLATLQQLGIITRETPATVARSDQSKQGRYRIADAYLRYYYRFLAPARTQLEQGYTKQVWATIRQHLEEYVGLFGFEELCREWVLRQGEDGRLPFVPRRVGSFWKRPGPQVDVVAINEDEHAILLGECKWTAAPLGRSTVLGLLEKTAAVVPGPLEAWKVYYAFFSKAGFTDEAKRAAGSAKCFWVDLEQLDRVLSNV
jgi:AAA+ ATPase superfamily predicted ATPase